MKSINQEVMALLDQYGSDKKTALKRNRKVSYLYALSELRESLLEWYDFKKEGKLLQIGADYGALTGLFARKTGQVTVLDESEESLDVVKMRYPKTGNIHCLCGNLTDIADESLSADFDYVTLIGGLKDPCAQQIEAAKKLLLPGGVLFVAACNPLGMKYLAGAKKDECCMTKKSLEELLTGGKFYYPMPDYRLPFTLYSDRYLPKKGDLTDTMAAYDYPAYLSLDVGASYDTVCEDGQFANFANSFLVLWKKGEQD